MPHAPRESMLCVCSSPPSPPAPPAAPQSDDYLAEDLWKRSGRKFAHSRAATLISKPVLSPCRKIAHPRQEGIRAGPETRFPHLSPPPPTVLATLRHKVPQCICQ